MTSFTTQECIMKKKMNKSELIRGVVSENPGLKASEVVALLKKKGVVVSAPLVYQTLKKSGSPVAKSAGKKRGRKPNSTVATAASSSMNDVFSTMQSFVTAAGGLDKAIAILNVFKS